MTGTKEGAPRASAAPAPCSLMVMPSWCLVPAAQVDGHSVATVESMADPDGTPHAIQAFVDEFAVQCGSTPASSSRRPASWGDPRSDRRRHPARARQPVPLHCYYPIMQAVRRANVVPVELDERVRMSVGQSRSATTPLPRPTGRSNTQAMPFRPEHCTPLSFLGPGSRPDAVDVGRCGAWVPGVVDITAADAPVNEYGHDARQPALVGSTTGCNRRRRCGQPLEADQIAVVITETRTAATAGAAIEVEWEDLPLVDTIDAALAHGAPLVHPERARRYHHLRIRKGDPDFGFALAYAVVDEVYEVPHQEHATFNLRPAPPPTSTRRTGHDRDRWPVDVEGREQVAHVLGLPDRSGSSTRRSARSAARGHVDPDRPWPARCASPNVVSTARSTAGGPGRVDRRSPQAAPRPYPHPPGGDPRRHVTALEADVDLDAGAYNYTSNKVLRNAICQSPAAPHPHADRQPGDLHHHRAGRQWLVVRRGLLCDRVGD